MLVCVCATQKPGKEESLLWYANRIQSITDLMISCIFNQFTLFTSQSTLSISTPLQAE